MNVSSFFSWSLSVERVDAGETPVQSEACVSSKWSGKDLLHIGQHEKWLPSITRGRFNEDLVLRLVENMDADADRLAPFEPKNDVKDFCFGGAIPPIWYERLSLASQYSSARRGTFC
jgi:hypothetical protein